MRLHEVMPDVRDAAARNAGGAADPDIIALAHDTRQVVPGALFFCVPGFTRDGHELAGQAVQAGAVALVVERTLDAVVPQVVVRSVRRAMAPAAARFYGNPASKLEVVGVTGTNGKTTTAFLVREMLEADGRQTGMLGTVKSVIGGAEHEVVRTTPEAIELQRTLRQMLDAGDRSCAMEVSSHALKLHRADAIPFAAAIFTNLTQDHLDFHPTMEDYFAAKRRLLVGSAPQHAVLNVDDEYGVRLADELPHAITFSLERDATYTAAAVSTGLEGSRFTVQGPDGELELSSPLRGRFNIYNVLGAFAAVRALGVTGEVARQALRTAGQVPGRFETVDEGQPFAVLVDYAHTPDSLENVLRCARELTTGRVHVVFGCGGDRDRAKRPLMGEIATRLADRTIITSDNPRSEAPEAIIAAILDGAAPGTAHIADRREAISETIAGATAGDVVLIAGKGHEGGQEFAGGRKLPFDDVAVAREVLRGVALVQ